MARGKPSRRAREVRISYGLPKDERGQLYHKCAVDFYREFLSDWEEWDVPPPTLDISLGELAEFLVKRKRMDPLPKRYTEAEWHLFIAKLNNVRTNFNKASLNSRAMGKVPIRWTYAIEPYIKGKVYVVKCCERLIDSSKQLHRAQTFVTTQRKNNKELFQGIIHANHSDKELNAYNDLYESSDRCFDAVGRTTERTIVAIAAPKRKLTKS